LFASRLRTILRQDPDIVMVGEIRDPETASIAMQASMTGHLVLSTLHPNDAPAVVSRLQDPRSACCYDLARRRSPRRRSAGAPAPRW